MDVRTKIKLVMRVPQTPASHPHIIRMISVYKDAVGKSFLAETHPELCVNPWKESFHLSNLSMMLWCAYEAGYQRGKGNIRRAGQLLRIAYCAFKRWENDF